MGANGSHSSVGSSSSGDVVFGQEVDRSSGAYKIWGDIRHCIRKPSSKRPKMSGTVFSRTLDSAEVKKLVVNGIQILKQLRHPSVLHFHDCVLNEKEVSLITERVDVLDVVVKSMDAAEIRAGILNIVDALVFLHEKACLSHNSLTASAIFVTPDGRWKLGSFEHASGFKDDSADDKSFISLLEFLVPLVDEATAADLESLKEGLGSGLVELKTLHECGQLRSTLSEITDFLEHIQLKADEEKVDFFRNLPERLLEISSESVGKRLVRLFLSRCVMLEPEAHEMFLPRLLQVNDILEERLYCTYLVPEVLRIFGVRDKSIRLALLRYFPLYCGYIDAEAAESRILPELTLGMYDTDDEIVSASLRAMADLVPILGGECVTGTVHTKHFSDGAPKQMKGNGVLPKCGVPSVANSVISTPSTPSKLVPTSTSSSPPTPAKSQVVRSEPAAVTVGTVDNEWSAWGSEDEEDGEKENNAENEEALAEPPVSSSESGDLKAEDSSRPVSRRSEKSNIGTEFSLPDIKAPVEDVDFFADMEPKFDSAPSLVDSLKTRAIVEASSTYLDSQKTIPVKFTLFSDKESSAETEMEHTETNGTSAWDAEDDLIID